MAFDETKKETLADLGFFKFNDNKGLYHFEIVCYDGGSPRTSYRRFRVTGEGDNLEVKPDKHKSWLTPSETKALLNGFQIATVWHVDNPEAETNSNEDKSVDPKLDAMAARLRNETNTQ